MTMSDEIVADEPPSGRVAWFADQRHLELIAVVVMSITAVLTAWTGFESTKWSGVMSTNFTEAGGRRASSILVSELQGTVIGYQNSLAIAWTDANAAGDAELAATYRSLFPDELEATFLEWEAMHVDARPASPLGLEGYGDDAFKRVIDLQLEADEKFQAGLEANQRSDNYVVTTVMAATVLFFSALATKLRQRRLQIAMLSIAMLGLFTTVAVVSTFPIKL